MRMDTKICEIQFGQSLWERLKDIGYLLLVIALLFLLTPSSDAAVTSFSYNDSHVAYLGLWTLVTTGSPFYYLQGPQSEVRFSATGTKLEVWSLLGCTATIDGGSPVTLASGQQTAFTGLSDTSHTVRLTACSEINADNLQAYRVTGSAPALTITSGFQIPIILTSTAFTNYGKLDAVDTASGTSILGAPGLAIWSGDGGIRFWSDATDIYFWGFGLSAPSSTVPPYVIVQDGVDVGTFTPSGVGQFELEHFKSGLSGTHEYRIQNVGLANSTTLLYYLYQVILPGGTGNGLLTTVEAAKKFFVPYGDSIVAEITNTIDARHGEWYLTGNLSGTADYRYGVPGVEVSGPTLAYLRDNTSFITNPRPQPNVVVNEGGVNDCIFGATTFQADYLTMLQNEQASLPPSTFILNRGILPTTYGCTFATFRGYQQAATAAYNATLPPTPACYFDTAGWINPTSGADTVDGLHLNNTGSLKTSNRMAPIVIGKLNGASYTVTGPEHGLLSTASTNFTVSMIGTATFTGDQTITIGDGGAGGTFTPSVGSPATGSVTVAPSNAATSFTFTYTPITYGQHTLTFTNGQNCWTDPQALNYTVGTAFLVGDLQ